MILGLTSSASSPFSNAAATACSNSGSVSMPDSFDSGEPRLRPKLRSSSSVKDVFEVDAEVFWLEELFAWVCFTSDVPGFVLWA